LPALFERGASGKRPDRGILAIEAAWTLGMGALIAAGYRARRRIIDKFELEGSTFRFSTLGVVEMQQRDLTEATDITDVSRSRGRPWGYQITFRGGNKVFLDLATPNALTAVQRISFSVFTRSDGRRVS
jgi:hypothetical protein